MFTLYYDSITDPIVLNKTIDIGRAVIYKKTGIVLDKMNVDTNKKVIYFYDSNGEYIQLNHDSINLDTYKGYKLIVNYDLNNNDNLIDYIFSLYPIVKEKIVYIDNIPLVSFDFQPDQILEDINSVLLGLVENNIFHIKYCKNIAKQFDIETVYDDTYISDRFTRYNMERALIDNIPRYNTQKSFGTDLLKIRYFASKIWSKFNKESQILDLILILSDGSLKVPLSNIADLELFESKLEKAVSEQKKINIYSISMSLELLIPIRELVGHGYIGQIGDKFYLVSNKPIDFHTVKSIEAESNKIKNWYKKHCTNLIGDETLEELVKMQVMGRLCIKEE